MKQRLAVAAPDPPAAGANNNNGFIKRSLFSRTRGGGGIVLLASSSSSSPPNGSGSGGGRMMMNNRSSSRNQQQRRRSWLSLFGCLVLGFGLGIVFVKRELTDNTLYYDDGSSLILAATTTQQLVSDFAATTAAALEGDGDTSDAEEEKQTREAAASSDQDQPPSSRDDNNNDKDKDAAGELVDESREAPVAGGEVVIKPAAVVGSVSVRTKETADEDAEEPENDSDKEEEETSSPAHDLAWKHVKDRERAYQSTSMAQTRAWLFRGVGYLYMQHGLVLVAQLLPEETPLRRRLGTVNSIRIVNHSSNTRFTNCHLFTLWVRVNGPEIFAGSAVARNGTSPACYWEFDFMLQVPGTYTVDVKTILYNGNAQVQHQRDCPVEESQDDEKDEKKKITASLLERYPYHYSFLGFKFYSAFLGCCEACARTPGCQHWLTPPLSHTSRFRGCELFFAEKPPYYDRLKQDEAKHQAFVKAKEEAAAANQTTTRHRRRDLLLQKQDTFGHGAPRAKRRAVTHLMSCGWSFWLTQNYACLNTSLDDAIPVYPTDTLTVVEAKEEEDQAQEEEEKQELPLCGSDTHEIQSNSSFLSGRWVREPYPTPQECPQSSKMIPTPIKVGITTFDDDNPHCWHTDDLTPYGMRCMEFCARGVHTPWISRLHQDSEWFGTWRPYNCRYVELTQADLQRCIDVKRIESIQVKGASVARFLQTYVDVRLQGIQFYNATNAKDASSRKPKKPLQVILTTLSSSHILWTTPTSKLAATVKQKAAALKPDPLTEGYFVSGFYYSSEREPHVTLERSRRLNQIMVKELVDPPGMRKAKRRNWHPIDAFDATAAFTFDTATQMDGLHIIGPPMKMIVTKFLHHLCVAALDRHEKVAEEERQAHFVFGKEAEKVEDE